MSHPSLVSEAIASQPVLSERAFPLCGTYAGRNDLRSQIIVGREAILQQSGMLIRFAERCEQAGAMQDLSYFLTKPGLLRRTPQLMLISGGPSRREVDADSLLGAVLLYDHRVLGRSLGMYTTNDRSGRSSLVAPVHLRSVVAEFATRTLVERGAHVVMISFRNGSAAPADDSERSSAAWKKRARWARRERVIAEYLPLESTYDATLAQIGKRTRGHMRYYLRRAEAQLGCCFCPSVELSKAEFLAFNRECSFAVPDRVAAWRYDVHRELAVPLFMGMHDNEGRWLSMVGARRFNESSEILWQMNRQGFPSHSLSLVMRCYFIEHEVLQGSRRFYLEGGSAHSIQNSFVKERVTDLAVLRRSPTALLTQRLVRHVVPGDNQLAHMLSDPELGWVSTRGSAGRAGFSPR